MSHVCCPSREELLGFHLGTLSDQQIDGVANHLEDCRTCQTHLQTLDDRTDCVISVLRRPVDTQLLGRPTGDNTGTEAPWPTDLLEAINGSGEGRLGPYRLLRLIGRGGMGYVFEAEDVRLLRRVALKVINPVMAADSEVRRRFVREARALAGVRANAHVVTIYEADEARNLPYLAMELLEGQSLDRWLAGRGPVPLADILRVGREAALGLAAAHEIGLIHRDVKPANLWVEAGSGSIKVLDFGLARPVGDSLLTQPNVIAGTPAYLSPEQTKGEPLDARSDLFSLGCVLYEVCAGRPAFRGKNPFAVMTALTWNDPVPLRQLRPDLPPALTGLATQLLEKDPKRRPASARAVAERLATIGPGRPGWRPRWGAAVLLAVGVLLCAALVRYLPPGKETGEEPPRGVKPPAETPSAAELWMRRVAGLPADEQVKEVTARLRELNPGFETDLTPAIEGGVVRGLQFRTDDVRDISPVRAFKGLRQLDCSGAAASRLFSDLSPLVGMELTELNCGHSGVADLSPLKGMKLTSLMCNSSNVTSLAPLEGMDLSDLNFGESRVSDLSPIKGMKLRLLGCAGTRIKDLSAVKGMDLETLWCNNTEIKDLSPLKGMPRLRTVRGHNMKVTSLEPLEGMPLTELTWDVRRGRDLDIVRAMTTLKRINDQPAADFWREIGMKGGD
jgi:hypothetical protein